MTNEEIDQNLDYLNEEVTKSTDLEYIKQTMYGIYTLLVEISRRLPDNTKIIPIK
jgi:hypothetical protein